MQLRFKKLLMLCMNLNTTILIMTLLFTCFNKLACINFSLVVIAKINYFITLMFSSKIKLPVLTHIILLSVDKNSKLTTKIK